MDRPTMGYSDLEPTPQFYLLVGAIVGVVGTFVVRFLLALITGEV